MLANENQNNHSKVTRTANNTAVIQLKQEPKEVQRVRSQTLSLYQVMVGLSIKSMQGRITVEFYLANTLLACELAHVGEQARASSPDSLSPDRFALRRSRA